MGTKKKSCLEKTNKLEFRVKNLSPQEWEFAVISNEKFVFILSYGTMAVYWNSCDYYLEKIIVKQS